MGPRSPGTPTRPATHGRTLPAPPRPARGDSVRPTAAPATQRPEQDARDIRRKRPPALSFLLRISTARRLTRVISLLALDFAGVALAIFTALVLKEAVNGHVSPDTAFHGTK